jgi:hypothetical protein
MVVARARAVDDGLRQMALERVNGLNNPREQSPRLIAIPFSRTELLGETSDLVPLVHACRGGFASPVRCIAQTHLAPFEPSERFTSTRIESVDVQWTFADADDDWTFLDDLTALGPLVGSLSDAARADLRTASSY